MRRRVAAVLGVAGLFAAALAVAANSGRPPLRVPTSPGTVLERLPHGYAALEPGTAARPPLAQARTLLDAAARTGDARLATRAEALLATLPRPEAPEALKARAFAAQHRHDFAGALRLLDAAIAHAPGDGDARLARAQVRLVQGRLPAARADCAALVLGMDADGGALCLIALSLRRGDYTQAASLTERELALITHDPALRRWLLATRGEIASRAGEAGADRWFRAALALAPDDVRTLAAFARHLRAHRRPRQALALLEAAPPTDGLRLQAALAAREAGAAAADALAADMDRRYALARALGTPPELRDEADYQLALRGDPFAALGLAQRNFGTQRDAEDVDVLARTARAAGRDDVLRALRRWSRDVGVPGPTP